MANISMFGMYNKEFYLDNVIERNLKNPRTFLIPSEENVEKLSVGDYVKLVFILKNPGVDDFASEKMWVKIISIQDDMFIGVLDNDPYCLKTIVAGNSISFMAENIASILWGNPQMNLKNLH